MTSPLPFFQVTKQDAHSHARLGVLATAHGIVNTPAFMPVGTQATVKTLDIRDLHECDAEIILGNTYHLHLRPGEDAIAAAGGIHRFMGWDRPVLTDSGGFQVFSLGSDLVKIDNDGVSFRSHIDGSSHRFTPESAIITQKKIGADIIMAFDECTKDSATEVEASAAMKRTHAWAVRCVEAMRVAGPHSYPQHLFGIVQGGVHENLRKESAKFIASLPFDGIAIGGESVGYHMDTTEHIIDWVRPELPEFAPRYTMGVGASPADLLRVVARGIDMFDCVAPTRMGRNGALFSKEARSAGKFRIAITNAQFSDDPAPISAWCSCRYCKGTESEPRVTRRYLHHLFKAEELLGLRIASYHNVHFMEQFMAELRTAIHQDRFAEFQREWS